MFFYKEADIVIDFTTKNNVTNALVDPATLVVSAKVYDATNEMVWSDSYTYGVDSELTRISLGTFRLIFAPAKAGKLVYSIKTTNPNGFELDAVAVKDNVI